ncbi:molybdopterin-dependent oxidoreductase [Streptomyces sp. N35]|uniref:molybdopterin-dependent oxidoreductase n=1 Tax=Streptomyces sp. N35 TaxID=2795730 RepID=UPI0018F3B058|nr:molybdopterin-dependent oxidoreductase [Streptomyces sp. N35]
MKGVSTGTTRAARGAWAALSGLVAGYAALAVAELVAVGARPSAGPVTAVGGAVIDRTPSDVKDWAIRTFGTDDKLVLQLGVLAVLALCAAGLGILAQRARRVAAAGVALIGALGAAAALSRPDAAGPLDALPALAGAVAGATVLYVLAGKLHSPVIAEAGATTTGGLPRRGFVLAGAGVAVAATGVGAAARALRANASATAQTARARVRLPVPASPAPPLARAVDLRIAGVAPFTTPNRDFYRVDTALRVPQVDPGGWRLRLHGKGVGSPRTLTFQELLDRPLIERDITMTCVSNEVGGPYVGSARWLGVPLANLLDEAGVRPPSRGGPADQLVARSVDGMTLGTPVETVMDGRDAMLAVGMNGEPLPFEHGFPVRMLVPGLYGYVSACKWIEDIELTTFAAYDPYWVQRDWAREAPIKTQSRIDTPKPFARPASGRVTVAGVAWAQHRGIERVEVRVDEGPWRRADLAPEGSPDTWRQWRWDWAATSGSHTLQVRATDGTGTPQAGERTRTIPDGASGWHSVVVNVT